MQIKSILLTIFAVAALVHAAEDVDPAIEQNECVEHARGYNPGKTDAEYQKLCRDCRISCTKQCASAKKSSDEKLHGSTCYETALTKCKVENGLAEPDAGTA